MWALSDELAIQIDDRFAGDPPGIINDLYWLNGAQVEESTIVTQFIAVAPQMAMMVDMAESNDTAFEELDNTPLDRWLDDNVPGAQYPELNGVLSTSPFNVP